MLNKKRIAKTLIALQMVSSILGAAGTYADSPSPEKMLLTRVYAIDGSSTNTADAQKRVAAAYQSYLTQAPEEGRSERFTKALVDMNIYSEDQAASLMNDVSTASDRIAANTSDLQGEFLQLVASHPKEGAQFSACAAGGVLVALGVASTVMGLIMFPAVNVTNAVKYSVAGGGFGILVLGVILVNTSGDEFCGA